MKIERKIALTGTIITTVCALFIAYISMPHHLTNHRDKTYIEKNIPTIFPQGWGFFTRNPREDSLTLYVKYNDKENWLKDPRGHATELKNGFGWDRSARAAEYDNTLVVQAAEENWSECKPEEKDVDCLGRVSENSLHQLDEHHNSLSEVCLFGVIAKKPTPLDYHDLDYKNPRNVIVAGTDC